MTRRGISERDRNWLVAELESWAALGLIDGTQASKIIDLYETPEELGLRRSDRGIQVLSGLAALLVGLAILLLVGFNWAILPDALKLIAIFITIAATHLGGLFLRYRLGQPAKSEVVFFLGCLFFGAGIFLVAQIFNLSAENFDGLWWWALGTLPFALLLDGALLHTLFVGLLGLYLWFSVLGRLDARVFFGSWRILGNSYLSVPLLALVGLGWAYRKRAPKVVGLYVPLLCWWLVLQPFAWGLRDNPVYFVGSVGCLLLILAECHREGDPMAVPYRLYGAMLVAGVLIPLTYFSFHSGIDVADFSPAILVETTAILVASVLAIAITVGIRRRSSGDGVPPAHSPLIANRRVLAPALLALCMGTVAFYEILVRDPIVPTLLANLAMLVLAFWLMMLGMKQDRGRPFTAGGVYFLLWAVLRYIDLFGDFGGMLGAAAMFFLCGATLFGLARYWQHRRLEPARHA